MRLPRPEQVEHDEAEEDRDERDVERDREREEEREESEDDRDRERERLDGRAGWVFHQPMAGRVRDRRLLRLSSYHFFLWRRDER